MSKYTTELRFICESESGLTESTGYQGVEEVLDNCWNKVIPQNWPIFDEAYRETLCKKIIRHYYTREIGMETVGLWQLKLETKLNEIMPYYNELYKTTVYEFNPLYDVDYTKTHTGADSGTSNDNSTGNAKTTQEDSNTDNTAGTENLGRTNYNLYSDTPQGALNGVDQERYLTNATKVTDSANRNTIGTRNSAFNGTRETENENARTASFANENEYVEHVIGKTNATNYGKVITEFRKSLLNIDVMIIDELKDLFFLLW